MCHELENLLRHRPSAAARETHRQERERERETERETERVGGMDRGGERGGRGGGGRERERCVTNSRIRCIRCGGCMYQVRRHLIHLIREFVTHVSGAAAPDTPDSKFVTHVSGAAAPGPSTAAQRYLLETPRQRTSA
jgi:hypothetical protein